VEDDVLRRQRWYCGPAGNGRAYAVDDIDALRDADATVVRAERLPHDDDHFDRADAHTGAVSLKLHLDPSAIDPVAMADRLRRIAAITHPNLGRPIESFLGPGLARDPDCADTTDDVFYVAARWEEGQPLRAAVPMAPSSALSVVRDVAGAVAALHDHGLAHRDLHPGNVIVRPDASAVVIDFGTVRPDDGTTTTTVAGVIGFIPPESLTGGRGSDGDRWSVGMLAVHALLGHPQGSTPIAALRRELETALDDTADPKRAASDILRMIDADPARRPSDLVGWVDAVERDMRRRPARRAVTVGLAAAVVVVAIALAFVVRARHDDASSTATTVPAAAAASPRPPPPSDQPGLSGRPPPPPGLGPPPGCPQGAVPLELGAPPRSCWGGPQEPFVRGSTRPVVDEDGRPMGTYVTAPDGRSVYLTETMWQSYSDIAGGTALESPASGGYPVGVDFYADPAAVAIRLDNGGLLIGPRPDTQLFWIPAQGVARWTEAGGLRGDLGFPASNVKVGVEDAVLEFEKGEMRVTADRIAPISDGQVVPIDLVVPGDRTGGLDVGAVRRHIIRQWGGTSWWVDGSGVRHWIPDQATWTCLGGTGAVAPRANDLHGWTVWLFPLGRPAMCADAAAKGS
jgi:Protein kinase domain